MSQARLPLFELLQLAEPHLTLTESAATLAGECAA
jgi:hypothetical protein